MDLFPNGLKLDMTKSLLSLYLQKKMQQQEQERQLGLQRQEQERQAGIFEQLLSESTPSYTPPVVGQGTGVFPEKVSSGVPSPATVAQAAASGMLPAFLNYQKSQEPNYEVMSLGKGRLVQFEPRNPAGTSQVFGGDLPEGFTGWRTDFDKLGNPIILGIGNRKYEQKRYYKNGIETEFTDKGDDVTDKPLSQQEKWMASDPNAITNIAKMMANYEIDPTSLSRFGGMRELIISKAKELNPKLSIPEYAQRYKSNLDYTSGKASTRVLQLNTVAAHLNQLDKAVDAMKTGDIKVLNDIALYFGTQTGNSREQVFNSIKTFVASELAGISKAGAGSASPTDQEIVQMAGTMAAGLSGKITKDVINSYKHVIGGRLRAEEKRYETGTAKEDFYERMLNPEAKEFFSDYQGMDSKTTDTGSDIPSDDEIDKMTPEQTKNFLAGKPWRIK